MTIAAHKLDFVGVNLASVERRLREAGIDQARGEALTLLRLVMEFSNTGQTTSLDERLEAALAERIAHRSLARIAGFKHFHGLALRLDDSVYEPCSSSERLVDHALSWSETMTGPIRVLDLGSGSGNLLLAALAGLPNATGVGVDINRAAVDLARANAVAHRLDQRCSFVAGDAHSMLLSDFDLVLSTLPWVPTRQLGHLRPEVRLYDPITALDGGLDGLDHFRGLASSLRHILTDRGRAFLQIGYERVVDARGLFEAAGYGVIDSLRDAYGFPIGLKVGR